MPIIRHSNSGYGVSPRRNDLEMQDGRGDSGEESSTGSIVLIAELAATDRLY